MCDIQIYFVGGTSCVWTDVTIEIADAMVDWLDNKEDAKTFKANFFNHNKETFVRKELIIFINVIQK